MNKEVLFRISVKRNFLSLTSLNFYVKKVLSRAWWSIILPISIKRTVASRFNSLNINKRPRHTYDNGNPGPDGVKLVNGIPTPPSW
jgi:hypothetical protein